MKFYGLIMMGLHACTLACVLAGCGAKESTPEPPEPPVLTLNPAPKSPPPLPKPVARVVNQFEKAIRRELVAVTGPHVTVELIYQLHAADVDARAAMDALMRQKLRPSAGTFATAQTAVAKLSEVLTRITSDAPP